ncbi:MAG: prepilin-type N-terminal cleavage/methylation domain-containing protein [Deltaproteobacteria bacterium]|nr:prepilin-type N-terminal cleavage/methylation domain-containing protein [Deltaproteobacteria bacterium]
MTKGRVAMLNFKFQSGFTLIELTIAITLVALMAVILYGAFHLGNRAVEKFQSRSEESQTLRASGELLAGYLRSAFPYRSSPRDPAIFFAGNEHELSFISALSRSLGGRGMSEIRIYWSDDGGRTGTLALEEKMPVRLESQADGGGYRSHIVLRQGIRDFRIEYQDSRGEGEDWVERWEGKERQALPRAVRLSYRGERGEKVEWVFPLMMTVLAP